MKKIMFIIVSFPCLLLGMDQRSASDEKSPASGVSYQLKPCDWNLWRAIEYSDDNGVLAALADGANQNYLWSASDAEYQRYADLTPVMYAVKRLRARNRLNHLSTLASTVAWDISKAVVVHMMPQVVQQYPMLKYTESLWNTRTAAFFLGSQSSSQQLADNNNPAKRLLYDLLTRNTTNLKITRTRQWKDKDGKLYDVTVLTYLASMQKSWNYFTREDGKDLSSKLRQIQLQKAGIQRIGEEKVIVNIPRPITSRIAGDAIFDGGRLSSRSSGSLTDVFPNDLEQARRERQSTRLVGYYLLDDNTNVQ